MSKGKIGENKVLRQTSVGFGVALGFGGVLVLMISLVVLGLFRVADMNRRLDRIVNSSNVKTEAAHEMIRALNNRAISMHSIGTLTDPFDRDEEYQRFNIEGVHYSSARERLESLPMSTAEAAILARIKTLTRNTQLITEEAIRQALSGRTDLSWVARTKAIPAQKLITDELDQLLELQHRETQAELDEAGRSYTDTVALMVLLGLGAFGVGSAIAVGVSRRASKQAALLQHQASFDSLTNLPNRALFSDRFEQAILAGLRENRAFALIAIDIDNFKGTNDTLGHSAGDRLLQQIAVRLRSNLRASDTVARMGGDEFTILLPSVSSIDAASAVTRKLINAVQAPLITDGKEFSIAASFGIAIFPQHGRDALTLSRHADAAMYAAKRARTGFEVYDGKLDADGNDNFNLQSELRRAAAGNGELILYYQPKVDLASGSVKGVEALVRWQHPTRGLLMPDRFIPLAEQTGIITRLTERVLTIALQQNRAWQAQGVHVQTAVNVSAVDIQDALFPDLIERLLRAHEVAPTLLELEVTETAIMGHPERAVACIKRLTALGVQVAIDDFGTGHSSMSYLKELLVAKIKIDRSFVADMLINHNDAVIVRATVELGHNLGLTVIAEGVENRETLDRLRAIGCDSAQGYYLSRPLPAAQVQEWIHRYEAHRHDDVPALG